MWWCLTTGTSASQVKGRLESLISQGFLTCEEVMNTAISFKVYRRGRTHHVLIDSWERASSLSSNRSLMEWTTDGFLSRTSTIAVSPRLLQKYGGANTEKQSPWIIEKKKIHPPWWCHYPTMDGTQHCHPSSDSNLSHLASRASGTLLTQGQIIVVSFLLRIWKPLKCCVEGLSVPRRQSCEAEASTGKSDSAAKQIWEVRCIARHFFSGWLKLVRGQRAVADSATTVWHTLVSLYEMLDTTNSERGTVGSSWLRVSEVLVLGHLVLLVWGL